MLYYELPYEGIRLIAADIRTVLKCEPPLQFPDCMLPVFLLFLISSLCLLQFPVRLRSKYAL